jgi:hypothetical protein
MSDHQLPHWPRPRYEGPGGKPFLFYAVHGEFRSLPALSIQAYRSNGLYPGLELRRYHRQAHSDFIASFEQGYLWERLVDENPAMAERIVRSNECLVLRGELDDRSDLNYLRDSVGILTFLLDHGAVCVYDPQMFFWWETDLWKRRIFEPADPVPHHHVVILTSEEEERALAHPHSLLWFHTRGMRKFGRPDLSIHNVPPHYHSAVIDLCERFIEFQAFGGVICPGYEIRMKNLPPGMTCRHAGSQEDPDFNNLHVEITLSA